MDESRIRNRKSRFLKSKIEIFLQTFGVDFDAVQTLHNTCITVNASDHRTAIASQVN